MTSALEPLLHFSYPSRPDLSMDLRHVRCNHLDRTLCNCHNVYSSSFSTWSFHCEMTSQIQLCGIVQQEDENVRVFTYDVDSLHATFSFLTVYYIVMPYASSWKVIKSSQNTTLNYNWYRVSRGNGQTLFVWLIRFLLGQTLTY